MPTGTAHTAQPLRVGDVTDQTAGVGGPTHNDASGPMEILLVEDGLTDARMTIYAIRRSKLHHRVTLMRTIADANDFIRRRGVYARAPVTSLLLLDVQLPDGSGLDWWQQLAKENCTPAATVILTASDDPAVRETAEAIGVTSFLQKPVREEDFMRIVRNHKRLIVTLV